jgi:hypothetical protein
MHVILTGPQHKKITALSSRTGLTTSELMRRAVDMYLGNQAKKP